MSMRHRLLGLAASLVIPVMPAFLSSFLPSFLTSFLSSFLVVLVPTTPVAAQSPFSLVVLPDTQNYSKFPQYTEHFENQTAWILEQVTGENPRNIAFVSHVGDIVNEGGDPQQWVRAAASMGILDDADGRPVVPYGITPGNHDYGITGDKTTGTDLYKENFGPWRYEGLPWFGGSDPSGNNTWQVFDGGGIPILHICLEDRPSINVTNGPTRDPAPLDWANGVIEAHPGLPTIVSTHNHVSHTIGGRSAWGEAIWQGLVRHHPQIFLVLCGHYAGPPPHGGEWWMVSDNDDGRPVVEMLQDFQSYPEGGQGWLRILTIDPVANELCVRTYSPSLDEYQTDSVEEIGQAASDFAIPIDFDTRFTFDPDPVTMLIERSIRQGADGYHGTIDRSIHAGGNDAGIGDAAAMTVRGGSSPRQALLAFQDLVEDAGIDPDLAIVSARIRLSISDGGEGVAIHPMRVAWDESSTWDDFGRDGIVPGFECDALPIAEFATTPQGRLEFDVTALLRSWVAGHTELGVVIRSLGNGGDLVQIDSSESDSPPRLIVVTESDDREVVELVHGVGGYAGGRDTMIRRLEPTLSFADADPLLIDGSDPDGAFRPSQGLMAFTDLRGPGGLPAGSRVLDARLHLSGVNPGSGIRLHRMLVPWTPETTWSDGFGSNGIQWDDAISTPEVPWIPDGFAAGRIGPFAFDVTASVRLWSVDPATNHGWALLPTGEDLWRVHGHDAADPARRPRLEVLIERPATTCLGDLDGNGHVDAADLGLLIGAWGTADPTADLNDDGHVDAADLGLLIGDWNCTAA
jgi:hypothetical protein